MMQDATCDLFILGRKEIVFKELSIIFIIHKYVFSPAL